METTRNPSPRTLQPLVALSLAALSLATLSSGLLAGCSSANEDGPAPVETAAPGDPDPPTDGAVVGSTEVADAVGSSFEPMMEGPHVAIVIDRQGGCATDDCREVFELALDGRWLFRGPDRTVETGTYEPSELVDLAASVRQEAIVLGPFGGRCPTELGGRERLYLVFDPDDLERTVLDVASCGDQLDADAPVLVALDLLRAAVGGP